MIRLIIFDFDGTLGDTRANIVMTMRDTMRALGLEEPSEDAIAATIGIPLADGFAQLYPGMAPEETQHCAVTYRQIFEKNRKLLIPGLFPHVKETLVVGDMPVDILMGRRAGAKTCAVTYGNASLKDLDMAKPDYIIGKISDLPVVLMLA